MNKEKIKSDLIESHLNTQEELIGFFHATYTPSFWWFFLIGPLSSFGTRSYYVAVTDQGLHLHKLSAFGKPDTYNYFPYAEISKLTLGKGFLTAPLKLSFANGRKLKLSTQLKGLATLAKLDDKTRDYLLLKFT